MSDTELLPYGKQIGFSDGNSLKVYDGFLDSKETSRTVVRRH